MAELSPQKMVPQEARPPRLAPWWTLQFWILTQNDGAARTWGTRIFFPGVLMAVTCGRPLVG